jgi:hypothetical protein
MPNQDTVQPGDVTQRVGVEVIRARGVDVDKLIKMLVANCRTRDFCCRAPHPALRGGSVLKERICRRVHVLTIR